MTQENTNEPKTFKVKITNIVQHRGYWYDEPKELNKEYTVYQYNHNPEWLRITKEASAMFIESCDCELIQDTPEPFMFQGYPLNVGDKLWSFMNGYETVEGINDRRSGYDYPIRTDTNSYTIDGKYHLSDKHPTLYWDKPQFEMPKKPEPKVKKYLVLFKDVTNEFKISKDYYASLVEFERIVPREPIQLILESAKEF